MNFNVSVEKKNVETALQYQSLSSQKLRSIIDNDVREMASVIGLDVGG
jgi:hypothetical protein